MTGADLEPLSVEYAYDAFDSLIGRKVFLSGSSTASESQHFIYDRTQVVLALDDAGDVENRYLWGPAVDQLLAQEDGYGTVEWALSDHLGTPRDWVNSSGTVVDHAEYDSFGRRLDTATIDAAFEWTGRYRDPLTGLQYNNARWYNPDIQRWMSEDIIWDGANKYAYVGNEPTGWIDPDGLQRRRPGGQSSHPWAGPSGSSYGTHGGIGGFGNSGGVYGSYGAYGGAVSYGAHGGMFMGPGATGSSPVPGAISAIASLACEPYDLFLTGQEIVNDPWNLWSYAGIGPLPSLVGKVGKQIGRHGDEIADVLGESHGIIRDRGRRLGQKQGREFRTDQLEICEYDTNYPSHVRGWLKNERRRIGQGRASGPRTPPGYELAHGRTTPAREGFDYSNSRLQGIDLNRLEEEIRRQYRRP